MSSGYQQTYGTDPVEEAAVEPESQFRAAHAKAGAVNHCPRREPGTPGYEAARELLDQHFPDGTTAANLLRAWSAKEIHLRVDVVSADKHGVYERRDGSSIRDFDKATDRPVTSLVITTGFRNPDRGAFEAARR